jgi:predicted nucleic acid-binding protein
LEVANKIAVAGLLGRLHIGEAQVMIGAIEKDIATVILDDSTARNKAKQLGLHVTGTLGVLLKAQQLGIIEDLAQEITKLRSAGMHLSDSVVKMLLAHK